MLIKNCSDKPFKNYPQQDQRHKDVSHISRERLESNFRRLMLKQYWLVTGNEFPSKEGSKRVDLDKAETHAK